jgi:hypothetical protein
VVSCSGFCFHFDICFLVPVLHSVYGFVSVLSLVLALKFVLFLNLLFVNIC